MLLGADFASTGADSERAPNFACLLFTCLGSPAAAVLAGGRMLPPPVAAPQIGCALGCPSQSRPCATPALLGHQGYDHIHLFDRQQRPERVRVSRLAAPPPTGGRGRALSRGLRGIRRGGTRGICTSSGPAG